jgi:hypothetical protein
MRGGEIHGSMGYPDEAETREDFDGRQASPWCGLLFSLPLDLDSKRWCPWILSGPKIAAWPASKKFG